MTPKRKPRYLAPHELKKTRPSRKESNRSLADRWTPLLATTKYTSIPNSFLDYCCYLEVAGEYLNSSDVMFIIHLFRFKWDQHPPHPSYAVLARLLRISPGAVRKIAQKLERMKFLVRTQRRENTSDGKPGQILGVSFDFTGLLEALEKKILEVQPGLKPEENRNSAG